MLKKFQKAADLNVNVRIDPIGGPSREEIQKYFRVFVSAYVLGTDGMLDGRQHEWFFGCVKVLQTGTFFYWGNEKDIRLFKNTDNPHARDAMKKLAAKLAKIIAPGYYPLVYHDKVVHIACNQIHDQLTAYAVMSG